MDIIGAQILSLLCLFASMIGVFLLPWCLIGQMKSNSLGSCSRFQTALSFANCVSGGVFIATFFVGLVPEVRETFAKVIQSYNIKSSYPFTELVLFLGFILALGIEQCVLSYQDRKDSHYTSIPSAVDDGSKTEMITDLNHSKLEKLSNDLNMTDYDSDACSRTLSLASKDSVTDSPNCTHIQMNNFSHHAHGGHSHADVSHYVKAGAGLRLGMLMVSLGVHSLFEGLALGLQNSVPVLINLMIGVAVHELLVAFAMGVNVSRLNLRTSVIIKLGLIFSASIPFGQIIGLVIGYYRTRPALAVNAVLQGLAAGTFIHVTFMEVIPAEFQESSYRVLKVFFIALGFMMLLGCSVIMENVMNK